MSADANSPEGKQAFEHAIDSVGGSKNKKPDGDGDDDDSDDEDDDDDEDEGADDSADAVMLASAPEGTDASKQPVVAL